MLKERCFSPLYAISLGLIYLISGCMREKDLLDEQVRKLCAMDGGIKVYEKVILPAQQFNEYGEILVPLRVNAKPWDEYLFDWETLYFKKGNPAMWRSHFKLIRRKDGKLLGESVAYSRRGGDFPGPWHDSSFGCPDGSDIKDLNRSVFIKGTKDSRE